MSSLPSFGRIKDYNSRTYTVERSAANVAASTAGQSLVPAQAGKRVAVLSYSLNAGATATPLTWHSQTPAAALTDIDFVHTCAANALMGHAMNATAEPLFVTKVGEGLAVTTGAGSTVGVRVIFAYID